MTNLDATIRLLGAALMAAWTVAAELDGATVAGIVIFAVGVVVGTICVLVSNFIVERRMRREHDNWIAAGKPERREGERRGRVHRRGW